MKNTMGKKLERQRVFPEPEERFGGFKGDLLMPRKPSDRSASTPIWFERSPRIRHELPEGEIEIAEPPAAGSKPEINWVSTFLPTMATLVIAVVMATVMGNSMMMLYTLPMTVAGVVASIVNYRNQTKRYNGQIENRRKKYTEYLSKTTEEIKEIRRRQLDALRLDDPDTAECLKIARDRSPRLWARSPLDADFASARIGSGPVELAVKLSIPKAGLSLEEDQLKAKPGEIKEKYSVVDGAPICCSILREQICGVVGTNESTKALIKNMILQLATHHSYTELKIVFVYNAADERELGWVKELPHTQNDGRTGAFAANTKEKAAELFDGFAEILKQRKLEAASNDSYGRAPVYLPYYLFVILEPAFLGKSDSINEYLFFNRNLGAGCIMAVRDVAQLPKECSELIVLRGEEGQIFNTSHASKKQAFVLDRLSEESYEAFGRCLKPLSCSDGVKKDSLPKSYSFYEMLGIRDIKEYDIQAAWSRANTVESLAAPLGITEGGKILFFDIHEKKYGPNGLVAGTAGSGKSALLISFILSMALRYSPREVGFVIIDFKGGSMANQIASLPHLMGTMSNLDGQELKRSLLSIQAEITRRQRVFQKYGISSIYEYTAKYKSGLVSDPLPHIILIVDEFAELKAKQPAFMDELISASRIGRALGFHLILSTQKPGGQVSDQIWANSRFKICLKAIEDSDSRDVLKSLLATKLVESGRAYLRVDNVDGAEGNSGLTLFQSAFSDAEIAMPGGEASSQRREAIRYVAEYCRSNHVEKLPDIFLPPLKQVIEYSTDEKETDRTVIGVYDDPENQFQGTFSIDPFSKNTVVIGSAQTGKTNLLQTIIRGITERYSPEEVNLYILDFASGMLKSFEPLNHVGGVVTPDEDEKFKNLIRLLASEAALRKKKFSELGISSHSAYCEAGRKDMPRIVLLIDNFAALHELYLVDEDPILKICQDGLSYGISVIVANSQTAGFGFRYQAHFSTRIALYCNNSTEYGALFEKCRDALPDIPGRCFVEKDKKFYQCQSFLAFSGEREIDRAESVKKYIAAQAEKYGSLNARAIPFIPDVLTVGDVLPYYAAAAAERGSIIAGLDYDTVSPLALDLNSVGMLAISGRSHFGRSNFLRYLITAAQQMRKEDFAFYIIDGIEKKLAGLKELPNVKMYGFLPDHALEAVRAVEEIARTRYEKMLGGSDGVLSGAPTLVLMLNSPDAIEAICENAPALAAFNSIMGKLKQMKVCVILGNYENVGVTFSAPEIVKKAKDERKLLLFDDIDNLKIFDLPFGTVKKYKKRLTLGDCYLIKGNDCMKLKTPKC